MEIHCLSIRIWQDLKDGLELNGHGTIKQNKFGTIYLEFVCIETNFKHTGNLVDTIPVDLLNQDEKLYGEFITLDEKLLTSEGFTVKIDVFSMRNKRVMHVILPYIKVVEKRPPWHKGNTYLRFEFSEHVDIPFNKSNETISTSSGRRSLSCNEAVVKNDNYEISILKEKEYSAVTVTGDFNVNEFLDCITFFVGFSCGIMPQPYIIVICVGDETRTQIKSINNQKSRKRSSNPIPSNITINEISEGNYSYTLLESMICLQQKNSKRFISIYNQWARVWHGFTSISDISELVLSVAIEGLLNDVYIPVFKESKTDVKLSDDIERLKKAIDTLDVDYNYKDRMKSSVSYWKNITASKAFDILFAEGVINSDDKKIWQTIRNDSAHPKIKDLDSAEERDKRNKVIRCLNLFNKLILNIIGYSGPINFFEVGNQTPAIMLEHIDVLNDKLIK